MSTFCDTKCNVSGIYFKKLAFVLTPQLVVTPQLVGTLQLVPVHASCLMRTGPDFFFCLCINTVQVSFIQ